MGHGCGKSWCDGEGPTFIGTAGQHKWDETCLLFASILMDLYFELGSISGTVQSDLLELGLRLGLPSTYLHWLRSIPLCSDQFLVSQTKIPHME